MHDHIVLDFGRIQNSTDDKLRKEWYENIVANATEGKALVLTTLHEEVDKFQQEGKVLNYILQLISMVEIDFFKYLIDTIKV